MLYHLPLIKSVHVKVTFHITVVIWWCKYKWIQTDTCIFDASWGMWAGEELRGHHTQQSGVYTHVIKWRYLHRLCHHVWNEVRLKRRCIHTVYCLSNRCTVWEMSSSYNTNKWTWTLIFGSHIFTKSQNVSTYG